ncbi:MAG: hypothetical protein RL670_457 [Actinomycetota bacterium]
MAASQSNPPQLPNQLFFGGDYNPEQWSRDVLQEDVRLMREAGVNLVTLGVFAWANLEVAEGEYRFVWLDEIIDLLHANGIGVDLATATASPPAWLTVKYPEMLPVNRSGVRLSHGGRQAYCPSSAIYRERSTALASQLAKRYAKHPAIVMWHVNNEYACHNAHCYCDVSAQAWRKWLQERYQTLDALNTAWGTDFWSQRYHDWAEVQPPRETTIGTAPNPSMTLDYFRFSNNEILNLYKSERDAIRAHDSTHPITTNFMSTFGARELDYFEWADEVDFVSTDHYLMSHDPDRHVDHAFGADLTRGWARGKSWLLMEHSTSAVNWQPVNLAKRNGELVQNSLNHVARGSQGALFFQWRASQRGSEKFHSALVSHEGTNNRIWRSVVELGEKLAALAPVAASQTAPAEVAIVFDYPSWWALSQPNLPSRLLDYPNFVQSWYRALWALGIRVDFVPATVTHDELAKYKLVLTPMTYLMSDHLESALLAFQSSGGNLVTSFFSGISDPTDAVKLGGYGGDYVKTGFGLRVAEFAPLLEATKLSDGKTASVWQQFAEVIDAKVIATFADSVAAGQPAITVRQVEQAKAWFVASWLDAAAAQEFFAEVARELGLSRDGDAKTEVVVRGDTRFEFDHSNQGVTWSTR